MQHHQHATRASTAVAAPPPPHMLVAGQHMTAKYATTAANTAQQQQQPQVGHHIASVAVATTPGDASYSTQQQQQHMRDVRLPHQTVYPIPPQTLRGAAPMHKVLQQQQHLNNNNNNNKTRNNNINNNKSNNHHHQQQQPSMHTPVLQQHPQHTGSNKVRNINNNHNGHHHHHHQQQQPAPPPPAPPAASAAHHYPQQLAYATHINATPSEHMGVATQQQQQTQPPAGAPPPPLPEHQRNGTAYHQQQAATQHHTIPMHGTQQKVPHMAPPHHYYNANGHSGGGTYTIYTTQPPHVPPTLPKQILQNPNRVLKPRQQQQQQVSSATATPTTLTPTHRAQQNATGAGGATAAQSTTVTTSTATNEPHDEQHQQPEMQQHINGNVIAPSSDNKENVLNLEQIQTDLKKRGEQQHNNELASNCSSNGSTQQRSNKNNNNSNNNNQSNILSNEDLSVQKNSKEKTPMCLVNELARFNKIIHQYRLTSEKGPAHCKRFTVTLKLGEEEYSAEGFKIKKAQHLAAAEAIEKTKYKHPVPKARRNEDSSQPRAHITPTVELNALAMKLGQQTYYLFDPRQMAEGEQLDPAHGMAQQPSPPPTLRGHVGNGAAYQQIQAANGMPMPVPPLPPHPHHARYMHGGHPHAPHGPVHARGMYPPKYPQRYPVINGMIVTGPPVPAERYYTLPPHRPTKITLIVGKQKFVGLGRTLQQAKHDAAARALQVLKTQSAEQQHQQSQEALDTSGSQDGDNKSPISKVHEIGIRRNMSVHFKVLREEGPAHMKNFVTACVVGSIKTEGEGNGKKISKKRSAEKMLEELRKLPPLTPTKSPLKRIKVKTPGKMSSASEGTKGGGGGGRGKRAISSALKEKQIEEDNANDEDNPITKLIQIQQGRKEKEPTFELISKNASEHSRRREFIIEVTAQGRVARGTGPNKKVAKRNAAQNLLIAMGLLEAPMETTKQNAAAVTAPPVPVLAPAAAASVNIINPTNTTNQMTATSNDPINTNTGTAIPNGAEPLPVTTTKSIENLEVPLITTPAGQVPGILILRQNKKHASKRKEAVLSVSKETEELNDAPTKHHDAPAATVVPDTTTTATTTHSTNAAADSSTQPTKPASSNGTIETSSSSTTLLASTAAPVVSAAVSSNVSSTSNSSSNTTANGNVASVTASSTTTSTASTTTTSTSSSTTKSSGGVHMKDQLLYLSKLLGFEVNFSDYPKGNHSEFLTIVTLSSDPPQICHGVGANSEESQNDAAKNALKILSELGLNCRK